MKRHGVVVKPTEDLGATFNPAAIKTDDGKFVMLVRSIPKGYKKVGKVNEFDGNYISHLSQWEGTSPDNFKLTDSKAIGPGEDFDKYGAEDPRITKIGEKYYIFYTSLAKPLGQPDSGQGVRIAMASTKDFKTFTKHGVIGPDRTSKAGALFESGGKLHFMWKDEHGVERTMMSPAPKDFENAEAWQEFWKKHDLEHDQLLGPQNNNYENFGIEPGAPPIETEKGLLTVYSSIACDGSEATNGSGWSISLMLLDKDDPKKIIAKTDAPFLKPESDYELQGDVNNVVFPCGAVVDDGRLYVYYGAADSLVAIASEDMDTVWKSMHPFKDNPAIRGEHKDKEDHKNIATRQKEAKEIISSIKSKKQKPAIPLNKLDKRSR